MNEPPLEELAEQIGDDYAKIKEFWSKTEHLKMEWRFSKATGWYQIGEIKKKRIFYLLPEEGGFTFRMVFNEKAIQKIKEEKVSVSISQKLNEAKKHPEGKPIDIKNDEFEMDLVKKIVAIKYQSMK